MSALVFPCGEIVETDGWLASHLGKTPTTYLDESGLILIVEENS